jgi:hypothetical protein
VKGASDTVLHTAATLTMRSPTETNLCCQLVLSLRQRGRGGEGAGGGGEAGATALARACVCQGRGGRFQGDHNVQCECFSPYVAL